MEFLPVRSMMANPGGWRILVLGLLVFICCNAVDAAVCTGFNCPPPNPCAGKPDNTPCESDNDLCTYDKCKSGQCVTGPTTICGSLAGSCIVPGHCVPATGMCSNTWKADGSTCNDNLDCTTNDTCKAGECIGTKTCLIGRAQCTQIICSPDFGGTCKTVPRADGTRCDDGNPCSVGDSCSAGKCVGTTPAPFGTNCSDNNLCTTGDHCNGLLCDGTLKQCRLNQCQASGSCATALGKCTYVYKPTNTPCNDGNPCTANDVCSVGVCAGTVQKCDTSNPCRQPGTCVVTASGLKNCKLGAAYANGTACTSTNKCATSASCKSGTCTALKYKLCIPPATCNTATGMCS